MPLPALTSHTLALGVVIHHNALLDAALAAVLAAPDRRQKAVVAEFADYIETPRESLARRLIELAPRRERASLRESILGAAVRVSV